LSRAAAITRLGIAGLLAFCGCESSSPRTALDRPNIVFLIADDQDFAHLGFQGSPAVRTPELDRIARQGAVFPDAHLPMSRCRPTLASFLSGRWPHETDTYFAYGEGTLDPAGSLPRLLRDAGYATFVAGKFWEGDPREMGFTHGSGRTQNSFVREGQKELFDFLDETGGRRPLFVWWAPKLPHTPHDPPHEHFAPFAEAPVLPPPWVGPDRADLFREKERVLWAMMSWLDAGVADLRRRLEALGFARRTIWIYVIDNGWANGVPSKGTPYEAGVRTPIVVAGEGVGGGLFADFVSTLDVTPTILDYAGVSVPETADGRSLRPRIEAGAAAPAGDPAILFGADYAAFAGGPQPDPSRDVIALYARDGRWKYVRWLQDIEESANEGRLRIVHEAADFPTRHAGDEELFDLRADPAERSNLAGVPEQAERVARMREAVQEWWAKACAGAQPAPASQASG
jgi:uncharacterized sulfatase